MSRHILFCRDYYFVAIYINLSRLIFFLATMPFRLAAKNLYLTWPRCTLASSEALQSLQQTFAPLSMTINHYLVCEESHKDGFPHLHAILWLNSEVSTRNANFADLSSGDQWFHGNYQSMKNEIRCVSYVTKCGNWISDSNERIESILTKKKKTTDIIANRIMNGIPLRELATEQPGMVMMNLARLRQFQAWYLTGAWTSSPLPKINMEPCVTTEQPIMRWLALNLWNAERPLRCPQLYLEGRPGTGKTTLISILEKTFKTYKPSYRIHWWDDFNETIELLVFDEFKGQVPCTFMNMILDGQSMIIPRRGGDYQKTRNIPVIICSNFPPNSAYQNTDSIEAFLGRLKHVQIHNFLKIFK